MDKIRNIVILFDGTGQDCNQDPPEKWTNVALLFKALKGVRKGDISQSKRYKDGVGTRSNESMSGGALGIGLDERVEEAYLALQQDVSLANLKGQIPRVFIFGFSRGAFAARWLASLVNDFGVPKNAAEVSLRKCFVDHRAGKRELGVELKRSGKAYHVEIEMLGVWDTVKASPEKDVDISGLPPNVKHAYHAMAIDEWRYLFDVTKFPDDPVRVLQLWFYGCHADVGGGYPDNKVASNVALKWMVDFAKQHGLILDEEKLQLDEDALVESVPFPHDELKDPGPLGVLWRETNKKFAHVDQYKREISVDERKHYSVDLWRDKAPDERDNLPEACVAWRPNDDGFGRA